MVAIERLDKRIISWWRISTLNKPFLEWKTFKQLVEFLLLENNKKSLSLWKLLPWKTNYVTWNKELVPKNGIFLKVVKYPTTCLEKRGLTKTTTVRNPQKVPPTKLRSCPPPPNSEGAPAKLRRCPAKLRRCPPPNSEGAPLNSEGAPRQTQKVPPPNLEGAPLNSEGAPRQTQKVPPPNSEGTPAKLRRCPR